MKKKYLIVGSFLALILSVSVLGISIFAASTKSFSVNNTIIFHGQASFMDFNLTAKITGTVDDSEERLTFEGWNYSELEENLPSEKSWIIQDPIKIKHEGMNPTDAHLTYTFTIENKGNRTLKATLNAPNPPIADWLKAQTFVSIEGGTERENNFQTVEIEKNAKATIRMRLSVVSVPEYGTQQSLNFTMTFDYDEN